MLPILKMEIQLCIKLKYVCWLFHQIDEKLTKVDLQRIDGITTTYKTQIDQSENENLYHHFMILLYILVV